MERQVYTAQSLSSGMQEFERAYGMTSQEFYARHMSGDDTLGVPRFERHVWASFCEDVQRMSPGDDAVMDRVSRSFAVPA